MSATGLRTWNYDPTNEYSDFLISWGTLGILYNTEMVDEEVDSWGYTVG